ncbi:MAG: hypothetical protein JRM80_05555 [Nitrososphaerota archaeon]|nr:hypothetical protein [Nitrososphaerota archaeon]
MQSPAGQTLPQQVMMKWYTTRTVLSGAWLGALAIMYFVLVYPVAIAEADPSDYRFTFFVIALIYAVDLGILSLEWLYKVVRPPKAIPPTTAAGKLNALGMGLRTAFVVSVGGSYVTGAAVATPTVFAFLQFLAGGGTVTILADYLHSIFATLLVTFGLVIVIYELAKIGKHKGTFKDWLVKARYPEVKLFYWMFAVAVIVQGFVGLFMLGTISPIGPFPFPFVGNLAYGLETLLRHIHGPLGAVTFALFTNLVYFRLRPEFSVR